MNENRIEPGYQYATLAMQVVSLGILGVAGYASQSDDTAMPLRIDSVAPIWMTGGAVAGVGMHFFSERLEHGMEGMGYHKSVVISSLAAAYLGSVCVLGQLPSPIISVTNVGHHVFGSCLGFITGQLGARLWSTFCSASPRQDALPV